MSGSVSGFIGFCAKTLGVEGITKRDRSLGLNGQGGHLFLWR